jgi:fatty acid synthase
MTKREIYVAGLSCRLPESNSPYEFFRNLIEKENMVTSYSKRWKEKVDDLPPKFGQLKQDLDSFDHKFFSTSGKQAEKMDLGLRLLLEVSYEAWVDAGMSLEEIKGSNTGVYVGSCSSDSQKAWLQNRDEITGYEHTGCAGSMMANRLSFFYDLKGPSENIDTACSSSLVAFHHAVSALEKGTCDTAIVGGISIILMPNGSMGFHRLKMLSPDGSCKSFDRSANGYARAEGVAAIILTTKKEAGYKPYAKVLGSATNNGGWNPSGITFPNGEMQKQLYKTVCKKARLKPKEIDYIEAHGTGTIAGDGEELGAIYSHYGKANPNLIIGSVKSNMGHAEGASGMAGLIKVLLSFENETLPPNLHFSKPNEKLKTMKVLTEPLPSWKGTRAAVSSFGFGGTNAHVILEKVSEEPTLPSSSLLTPLAHRTKGGLAALKKSLQAASFAKGAFSIPNSENKQKLPFRDVLELPDAPDASSVGETDGKVYIVCSGNGSQWKGMGTQLYETFAPFKKTIDLASQAVGKDLAKLLKTGWSDALDSTLTLIAIELSLIELIRSFGIGKDQIGAFLGHSAGEITCSYLDGLTTLEETMKIAHARGFIANQTGDQGMMASIGLSKEEMEQILKEKGYADKVVVACINSPRNVTISGLKEAVLEIVEEMNRKDIFNRSLDTYGKAYHSPLFLKHKATLEELLSKSFNGKKASRSDRWLTTVLGRKSQDFDPSYHVEGVLKAVDFRSAIDKIPKNQVVLEIGPHSILKTLVKDNRPDLKYACLMKRETDEVATLKEGLGELWRFGIDLDFSNGNKAARPPLEIREKMVSWDHSEKFPVPRQADFEGTQIAQHKVIYDLSSEKDRFLSGHVVNGNILLPATSYLCALWEAFRKSEQTELTDSVTYSFSNFEIIQAVQVQDNSRVELLVKSLGSKYCLFYKNELIAQAHIELLPQKEWRGLDARDPDKEKVIEEGQFYRIVGNLGYEYSGQFSVVHKLLNSYEKNESYALLKWENKNWITFLDGMLQVQLIAPRESQKELRVPVRIGNIQINPKFLSEYGKEVPAIADFYTGSIRAPGIEMSRMETKAMGRASLEKKMDTKKAISTLFYGCNAIEDPFSDNYQRFLINYGIAHAKSLITKKGLANEGHYKRVLAAYEKWGKYVPVDMEEEALYRNHPGCIFFRILEDLYLKCPDSFLETPLAEITQHPEYQALYSDDIGAKFISENQLDDFLSVVRSNTKRKDLNILEIGIGTGGLTRLITPFLLNDRYIGSDINSIATFVSDELIKKANPIYESFNLDVEKDYEIFKKHSIDLILASNSLHAGLNIDRILTRLYDHLTEGAFGIVYEATSPLCLPLWGIDRIAWQFEDERDYGLWCSIETWLQKFAKAGFEVISYTKSKEDLNALFLIRKPVRLHFKAVLDAPSIDGFEKWASQLKVSEKPVLLVARTQEQSGVHPFARSLNLEEVSNNYYTLTTDQELKAEQIEQIQRYGLVNNVFKKERLGAPCFTQLKFEDKKRENFGFHLHFPSAGDFSNYQWIEHGRLEEGEVQCTVKYAALNFKDVMLASGKIDSAVFEGSRAHAAIPIGFEFSGQDPFGNRVMGFGEKVIGSHARTTLSRLIPIPDSLSYEEAATIPVVYGTVLYSLYERAHIQEGQSILIHAGAGGVGQAAIRVALSLNCKIFTTCHPKKKKFLKQLFPALDEDFIFNSRTTDFEWQIMEKTEGKGVDIVLNSLADEKLQASLRCVARYGHFIEIGKYDLMKHTPLDMNLFNKSISVHGVDLSQVFAKEDALKRVTYLIKEGLRTGVVQPLPTHVFPYTQVDEAFRFMGSGHHAGKVLIDMDGAYETLSKTHSKPSFWHDANDSGYFLLTGGLGGFGLALIEWLFSRGVRRFLITSRRGVSTGEQKGLLDQLTHKGADIIISTKDVAKYEEAAALIETVQGNISAIFHLAMTLQDNLFDKMTQKEWDTAVQIKARGAMHLDLLTRKQAVKYFVGFSSMMAFFGNVGQSNYGFANAVIENVCQSRLESGYPALAIEWGAIGGVGAVANNQSALQGFGQSFPHIAFVSIEEALQFMDQVLSQRVNSSSIHYSSNRFAAAQTSQETFTSAEVLEKIGLVLKTDLMKCLPNDTLETLGVDSLQTVEIQTILIRSISEVLPLKKISSMKVQELIALVESKSNSPSASSSAATKANENLSSIIQPIHKVEAKKKIVYLFLGYGLDSKKVTFPSASFNLSVIAWENGASLDAIEASILSDMKDHQYQEVSFLTHSAGYQLARGLIHRKKIHVSRLASVSIMSDEIFAVTEAVHKLENVEDALAEKMYKDLAFAVKDPLPTLKIRQQSLLLANLGKMNPLLPDIVITPREDNLCDRTLKGIELPGDHDIRSLDMKQLYALMEG